jgi:tripartite-type tricarboxylate transporter receptor subunit TctC
MKMPALWPAFFFNGTGPAMNALVAGQVDYMCDQIVNAVPQINAGTIKAYAIATPERNPSLPNVPTTAEAGLPTFQAQAWNAMFAPKGANARSRSGPRCSSRQVKPAQSSR